VLILTKIGLGYILGDFFIKIIRSPWQQAAWHSIAFHGVDVGSRNSLLLKMEFSGKQKNKAEVFLRWIDEARLSEYVCFRNYVGDFVDP
jgi:hypothetical protein